MAVLSHDSSFIQSNTGWVFHVHLHKQNYNRLFEHTACTDNAVVGRAAVGLGDMA